MLKYQSTRMGWLVADETVQILGGRGITKTGMGARVEGFKNFVKYAAVCESSYAPTHPPPPHHAHSIFRAHTL
jgi:hypothetical protein